MPEAKPVFDCQQVLEMVCSSGDTKSGPPRQDFYNPFPRIVHVEENGVQFGFGPGHNYCDNPELSEKLKAFVSKYGIQVL
jgi:hypothetical protein